MLLRTEVNQISGTYPGREFSKILTGQLNCNSRFPSSAELGKYIRQFLEKANFYHKYIPSSTRLLEPLHALLRKRVEFEWSADCERAFQEIKNHLCSEPILAIYNSKLDYYSNRREPRRWVQY